MAKVTVSIPTYNRARFIGKAVDSVLAQTYKDIEILIIDNASTDDTQKIISSFDDNRIKYVKNEENIGIIGNWNKCIGLTQGQYLMILGDDDVLHCDFIKKSLEAHEKYSEVAFTFTRCNKVDECENIIQEWGYNFTPPNYLKGIDYLFYTLEYEACLTNSSTVLLKKHVFDELGDFRVEFARNVFDFNMWIRIASKYNVYFIDEILCDYRIHKDQISQLHWREQKTGKVGTYLELLNILSNLMHGQYEFPKNDYVSHKLHVLVTKLSGYLRELNQYL
ncbi:MAG: glycosyltransferase [bacterium]|nr:glycosyltransferase [bacterium]